MAIDIVLTMPSVNIPVGFALVHIRYTNVQGHNCQNSVGYDLTDVLTQTDVDDLSDLIGPAYRQVLSTASQYLGLHVEVGNDGPEIIFDSTSSAGAGVRGGDEPPPMVQALIKKQTGLGGRANRGRMFIPDQLESQMDNNGTLNGTALSLLQDIAIAVAGPGVAPWGAPQLMHPIAAPTEITAFVVDSKVATLRRRYTR